MNFFDKMAMDASQLQAPEWQGQQQQPQQQKPQGLLGNIRSSVRQATQNPDFMDRLAIGLGGMSMNPNRGIIQSAQNDRLLRSREQAQQQALEKQNAIKNRTMQHLASMGTPQAVNALKYIQAGGNVNEALKMTFAEQKDQGRTVDASQLRQLYPNAEIADGLYNVKADGTINKVGGAGTTVNVGNELEPFDKIAQTQIANIYAGEMTAGMAARRTLSNVNLLDKLLSNSNTGGFEAQMKTLAKNTFGVDIGSDNLTAANALIAQLVPQQRVAGSGTMSDGDLALYKSSLPSILNKEGGNAIIVKTMRGLAEYQIKMGEIAQRALDRQITRDEAYQLTKQLDDPLKDAMAFIDSNNVADAPQDLGSSQGVTVVNIEREQ